MLCSALSCDRILDVRIDCASVSECDVSNAGDWTNAQRPTGILRFGEVNEERVAQAILPFCIFTRPGVDHQLPCMAICFAHGNLCATNDNSTATLGRGGFLLVRLKLPDFRHERSGGVDSQ